MSSWRVRPVIMIGVMAAMICFFAVAAWAQNTLDVSWSSLTSGVSSLAAENATLSSTGSVHVVWDGDAYVQVVITPDGATVNVDTGQPVIPETPPPTINPVPTADDSAVPPMIPADTTIPAAVVPPTVPATTEDTTPIVPPAVTVPDTTAASNPIPDSPGGGPVPSTTPITAPVPTSYASSPPPASSDVPAAPIKDPVLPAPVATPIATPTVTLPDSGGGYATGSAVIAEAEKYLGTPFVFGGQGSCIPYAAMDCSCFTQTVYGAFGYSLPDDPAAQFYYGTPVYGTPQAGDLVFFNEGGYGISHVGIALGNGNIIHASDYYGDVVISSMQYINGYVGARRLV